MSEPVFIDGIYTRTEWGVSQDGKPTYPVQEERHARADAEFLGGTVVRRTLTVSMWEVDA